MMAVPLRPSMPPSVPLLVSRPVLLSVPRPVLLSSVPRPVPLSVLLAVQLSVPRRPVLLSVPRRQGFESVPETLFL